MIGFSTRIKGAEAAFKFEPSGKGSGKGIGLMAKELLSRDSGLEVLVGSGVCNFLSC